MKMVSKNIDVANIKIIRADKVKDLDVRGGIAQIFGEGFSKWLKYFSTNPNTIAKAFKHSFALDQFYVAIINNEIAGMVVCTDCKTLSLRLDKKELRKYFGFYKGTIAGIVLKREFESPMENPPENTGSIEYVGTATKYQGMGVAASIIEYILFNTSFQDYIIAEVADTNIPAMKLYEKIGFSPYKKKSLSPKQAKKIGINKFVSFIYTGK